MPIRHALTAVLLTVAVGTARAATLSATLNGSSLSVDSPCAASVTVTPDSALQGHGDVTVEQATMQTFRVDLSGAGHIAINAGHIGQARLETSGAGHMQIGAEVDDAHVDLSGVGSVHFNKVNGQLTKDVSGFGSVTVQ